jgi:large subunit ribosomal protein L24
MANPLNKAVSRPKVRKGDLVKVLSGKDRGKSGKVLAVLPKKGKILIERINLVKRHTKPSQTQQQGGIIEKEAPMSLSKVMVLDPRTNAASRLGRKRLPDGALVRFVKKSGEMIEATKA